MAASKQRARMAALNRPDVEEALIRTSELHCDLPAIAKWEGGPKNEMSMPVRKALRKHLDEGPGLV